MLVMDPLCESGGVLMGSDALCEGNVKWDMNHGDDGMLVMVTDSAVNSSADIDSNAAINSHLILTVTMVMLMIARLTITLLTFLITVRQTVMTEMLRLKGDGGMVAT